MKDEAHITVNPKRKVIFRGADMVAEIAKLKADVKRERDAAYVRGLERAQKVISSVILDLEQMVHDAIAAEIDLEAFKRVRTAEDEIDKAKAK